MALGACPVTPASSPKTGEAAAFQALTVSRPAENGMGQHYLDRSHPVVEFALRVAQNLESPRMLDLGTGRGLVATAVADLVPGSRIVATDICEDGLLELRGQGSRFGDRLKVLRFDAGSGRLPESWREKFDLVTAKDVYPFLTPPQWRAMFGSAAAALPPGGTFIFTAPHTDSRLYCEGSETGDPYVRGLGKEARDFVQTSLTEFSFTDERHISAALREAGFSVECCFRFGRANGWLCVAATKG